MVDLIDLNKSEYYMHIESNRLKSFSSWPFTSNCKCTPEKMAAAGFYHCPTDGEPDAARCFVCYKELDGWEPEDDPWEEHRKHAPTCAFLKLGGNQVEDITVEHYMKLEVTRQKNRLRKILEAKIHEFEVHASAVKEEMEHLA